MSLRTWARKLARWNWLGLEIAFGLGTIFGIVITMLILSAFLFDILTGLVAAGTLFLGAASFYQTASANRERKSRQLAEAIYIPLREEVYTWLNPVIPTDTTKIISATWDVWPALKQERLYWIPKIPKGLVEELDEVIAAFNIVQELIPRILLITRTSLQKLVEEPEKRTSPPNLHFRIVGDKKLFSETISLTKVFCSGMTLKEFLSAILKANAREDSYELQLIDDDNRHVSSGIQTEILAEQVLKSLATQPTAIEMRSSLNRIGDLSTKALSVIDRQLDLG